MGKSRSIAHQSDGDWEACMGKGKTTRSAGRPVGPPFGQIHEPGPPGLRTWSGCPVLEGTTAAPKGDRRSAAAMRSAGQRPAGPGGPDNECRGGVTGPAPMAGGTPSVAFSENPGPVVGAAPATERCPPVADHGRPITSRRLPWHSRHIKRACCTPGTP